jgi:hypothetical protein
MANRRSDQQLVELLDDDMWIIRGRSTAILGNSGTLRNALIQTFNLSMHGISPGSIFKSASIRMPDDEIVIEHEQIFRLWKFPGLRLAA